MTKKNFLKLQDKINNNLNLFTLKDYKTTTLIFKSEINIIENIEVFNKYCYYDFKNTKTLLKIDIVYYLDSNDIEFIYNILKNIEEVLTCKQLI